MTIGLTAITPDIGVDMTGVNLEDAAEDPGFLRVLRAALEEHLQ